jgi:hypothetical protein
MFDQVGIAVVGKTGRESSEDAGLGLDLPQEEAAGVRSDGPAVESGSNGPSAEPLEIELACVTLCSHWTVSMFVALFVSVKQLMPQKAVPFSIGV